MRQSGAGDLEPEVFADGERADEEILLLDVRRQTGHAAADTAAVHSHFTADEQLAAVTVRQHVQQRRLARTAVHAHAAQPVSAWSLVLSRV